MTSPTTGFSLPILLLPISALKLFLTLTYGLPISRKFLHNGVPRISESLLNP